MKTYLLKMLEALSIPAVVGMLESGALPALSAFIASELIGLSKKTKSNSVLQLLFRVVKAVAKELAAKEEVKPEVKKLDLVGITDTEEFKALVATKMKEAIESGQSEATFAVTKPCCAPKKRGRPRKTSTS